MLLAALRDIETCAHLGRLFAALGYETDDLPFTESTTIVARWKRFKVVATDSHAPREAVRQLARKLGATTDRALAAAVGPQRELALASPSFGQPGITRVLALSLDTPSAFALQQLERLRPKGSSTGLAHALSVAEVLSSEEVSERFFTGFRTTLDRMAASIDNRRSAADRRMVALLNLTRILFLYFVQAKGWLDGRRDYLKSLLDAALAERRQFHRTALHPLFFGTLNRPPAQRSKRHELGEIPYLNGGLFEPQPVERRIGTVCFSNELWRDAFDELFERFRFCVREAYEADAIAPDMLGRVFERLMNGEERHRTGTFYTPESVVRQIVAATIQTALTRDLPDETARRVVSRLPLSGHETTVAHRALRSIRILDPAVGSGAFLLDALEAICDMRIALEPAEHRDARLRMRREILRDNLMGVDLNPIAVHLAELRLWLAVVADDPTSRISEVAPLPNLDGVVRQGDTLLDPLGAARLFSSNSLFTSSQVASAVRSARLALFDARGREQGHSFRRLRHLETRMAGRLLQRALDSTSRATEDLTAQAKSRDLFGKRAGLTVAQRRRHRTLKRVRGQLERARRQLEDGVLPFFSFEVHAPDVLQLGGFSAVIGNPPWVRAEHLPAAHRAALQERFRWWQSGGERGFGHLPDLSVAFIERCIELTIPGGAVGLLVPSKVVTSGYGEAVRGGLVRETSIAYVHRVSEQDATRFGATTYPLAIVMKKQPPAEDHAVHLTFGGSDSIAQRYLGVPGPWLLLSTKHRQAVEEFRSAGQPLGELASPMLGVKTGADRVFVGTLIETHGSNAVVAFDHRRVKVERSLLRPALRGRDVRAFRAHPRRCILWLHDASGAPLTRLPRNAARYVTQQSGRLRARGDYRVGPVWTVFRLGGVLARDRVVWPDIAQRPRAVVLEETGEPAAVPLNTCYVTPAPDRDTALVIAAVLNSTWSKALVGIAADEARGRYRRINARIAQQIPIPIEGPGRSDLVELSRRAHKHGDVSNEDLDETVADALELSPQTRRGLRSLAADNR